MIFLFLLFITAFLISSVSAYFSISGLTAIFPNAVLPIISMGVVLEMGKLVTASFVYQYWHKQKALTRTVLLGMTIVLSLLSSVGVYGYLSRKHIEGTGDISTSASQVDAVQRQIDMEQGNVTFLQQSLAQGDRVVNNYLSDTTQTRRAESSRNRLMQERKQTQAQIAEANGKLLELQRQRDSLAQIQRIKEVDVGPLKYLAALISPDTNIDTVVQWFILTLVFVLDPLALLLVVAGNIHRKETLGVEPVQPIAVKEEIQPIAVENTILPESNDNVTSVSSDVKITQELDFRRPEKWEPPRP